MIDYCLKKLNLYTDLSREEEDAFESAIDKKVHYVRDDDVLSIGKEPQSLYVIILGWASRYKLLANGRKYIVAYLIPGDICDVHISLLRRMDYSLRAETPMVIGIIKSKNLDILMMRYPRLAKAMFWSMKVDESIAREWLVNVGGRPAEIRIAHLICELFLRSQMVGLTKDNTFSLPVSQAKISAAMGLTPVHTNRTIQALRHRGLIATKQRYVQIPDWERLKAFAEFDASYLHLNAG